jgi:hypothetical protein
MHPVDAYVPRVLSALVPRHRWGHCGYSCGPTKAMGAVSDLLAEGCNYVTV